MYDKFPLTLAALEELELESSGGQCPSCSACWAVGDALLKECGDDPVWDVEWEESFKGGLKLRRAADWLFDHGMTGHSALDLLNYRETARHFPPQTRLMNVTWVAHMESMTIDEVPEVLARAAASLDGILSVTELDFDAFKKYGPG